MAGADAGVAVTPGPIAVVELTRPERRNAFDRPLYARLRQALVELAADPSTRVVVLRGRGPAFSAGADLKARSGPQAAQAADVEGTLRDFANPLVMTIRELPLPVIAAPHGPAVGIGCSIVLACDLILAAETASFQTGFGAIGLGPDGGASLTLAARVGLSRAMRMLLLGERVTAERALEWGLVDQVSTPARHAHDVDAAATRIAARPAGSHAAVKAAVNRWLAEPLARQLAYEATRQGILGSSPEHLAALEAFMARR